MIHIADGNGLETGLIQGRQNDRQNEAYKMMKPAGLFLGGQCSPSALHHSAPIILPQTPITPPLTQRWRGFGRHRNGCFKFF